MLRSDLHEAARHFSRWLNALLKPDTENSFRPSSWYRDKKSATPFSAAGTYTTSMLMCPMVATAHAESGPLSTYLVNCSAWWSVSTRNGKLLESA